jgi:hypothetical protein
MRKLEKSWHEFFGTDAPFEKPESYPIYSRELFRLEGSWGLWPDKGKRVREGRMSWWCNDCNTAFAKLPIPRHTEGMRDMLFSYRQHRKIATPLNGKGVWDIPPEGPRHYYLNKTARTSRMKLGFTPANENLAPTLKFEVYPKSNTTAEWESPSEVLAATNRVITFGDFWDWLAADRLKLVFAKEEVAKETVDDIPINTVPSCGACGCTAETRPDLDIIRERMLEDRQYGMTYRYTPDQGTGRSMLALFLVSGIDKWHCTIECPRP